MSDDQVSTERWRAIPGWEGFYEVSDHGYVRSLDRIVKTGYGGHRLAPGRVLKPFRDIGGYSIVSLSRYGKSQMKRVHHAVLEAFVGERPPELEGCHNDGDPSNNHVSNLRWDTSKANQQDVLRHGRHHYARRDRCVNGHEFTPENTHRPRHQPGRRRCRECMKLCSRNARLRRAVAA